MKIKCCLVLLLALAGCSKSNGERVTDYVDPLIGTGGHGHVFVGANVPFGMVQVGPTSIPQEWDWCSGYHASDSTVIGFSHTHLSGTGIGDLFDITIMPVVGGVTYARGNSQSYDSGLWSYSDRSRQIVEPGYYSVPLLRYDVEAEMTATCRVGMHRYTFPKSDSSAVVFDLENGGCWDRAVKTYITAEGNNIVSGYRYSRGWANDQRVFFVAEFSKPFKRFEEVNNNYARVSFDTEDGEQLLVKVALSPVSVDGARANMKAEIPDWDFEAVRGKAVDAWEQQLSKISIKTEDVQARKIFYTALYHTMIAPSEFCDANGDYYGSDKVIHTNPGFVNHTTFSLWDTYRAAQPLMSIVHWERMPHIINTMLAICNEQGKLPVWHLWGNETNCMVGNPGACVVADAIVKGIDGFDKEIAMKSIIQSLKLDNRGQGLRNEYGYIPCDMFNEAVAYDMENAIADGAAALAAKALNKAGEYEFFKNRSRSYRNYFDTTTMFIRGRDSEGNWRTPFSPFRSSHRADDYCEGNAWQYTWLVPHDVEGLEKCFGSRERMIAKLDSLFIVSPVVEGEDVSPDISGMIGQYAHGNEPSHHILYLYTMLGEPWKCADKVREVLATLYHANPDGLSGNEDVGQMSAWYILSSMGFYQVNPADGKFWFGSPLFDDVKIKVSGGVFEIIAENNSHENRYIQKVWLNGKVYDKSYVNYSDIVAGGQLRFEMGNTPCKIGREDASDKNGGKL